MFYVIFLPSLFSLKSSKIFVSTRFIITREEHQIQTDSTQKTIATEIQFAIEESYLNKGNNNKKNLKKVEKP